MVGGYARVDDAAVAGHTAAFLREKPIKQGAMFFDFAPDHRRPQGEGILRRNFTKELGAAIQVLRVRWILFRVTAPQPGEHAIRGEMNDAATPRTSPRCQLMRQQRVECDTRGD